VCVAGKLWKGDLLPHAVFVNEYGRRRRWWAAVCGASGESELKSFAERGGSVPIGPADLEHAAVRVGGVRSVAAAAQLGELCIGGAGVGGGI